MLQRISLDEAAHLVKTKDEVYRAARERSMAVERAIRGFSSQFLSNLHALLGRNRLCSLYDDKFFECNPVKQLQLTAPALPFVFDSFSDEAV